METINSKFFEAIRDGDIEEIKLFLKKGVDIEIKNDNGCTPLIIACSEGRFDAVKFLVEVAAADIENVDKNGWTPLLYSCHHGKLEIVKYLVEMGADVDKSNGRGSVTPLISCFINNHTEIMKFLIEQGANVDKDNIYSDSLISMLGCDEGEEEYREIIDLIKDIQLRKAMVKPHRKRDS